MKFQVFTFLVLSTLILSSCSGYRLRKKNNPFIWYDIRTVSIPMFTNQTTLPFVSSPMTKEIFLLLSEYKGLRVYPGINKSTDAVLLGIVGSTNKLDQTIKTISTTTVKALDGGESAIGARQDFFIPKESTLNWKLTLILVKKPLKGELEVLSSSLGKHVSVHPKVIFYESFDLTSTFERTRFNDSDNGLRGHEVNFTQNRGKVNRAVDDVAKVAATKFKELILRAF